MTRTLRITLLIALLLLPAWTAAEVIHLKDGTTIKVSKTWEEGGWVRFYLEDYEGIVITYAKDIIDRIETDDGKILKKYAPQEPPKAGPAVKQPADNAKPAPAAAVIAKPAAPAQKEPAAPVAPTPAQPAPAPAPQPAKAAAAPAVAAPAQPPPAAPAAKPQQTTKTLPPAPAAKPAAQPTTSAAAALPASTAPAAANQPAAVSDEFSQYEGVLFYDPRRPYKFWSGPNKKHRTLKEAVDALAIKFNRTPEWVQQNLGDTNDLAQIYRNVGRTSVRKQIQPAADTLAANGLAFYDPRRHYKFHLNAKLKFRTLDEAAQALARQYERSPEWVKEHLGETNDVGEIHQNLTRAKAAETQ